MVITTDVLESSEAHSNITDVDIEVMSDFGWTIVLPTRTALSLADAALSRYNPICCALVRAIIKINRVLGFPFTAKRPYREYPIVY